MALITAEQARAYLPSLTGTAEDTKLDTLIARVGAQLARWCGYPPPSASGSPTMESTSYTRYLDGPGGRKLQLPIWPVTAIASIYDDPDLDFGADTLVDSGDYSLINGAAGEVLLTSTAEHGAWGEEEGCIKVTFTAGFTTVPEDLKGIACEAVKWIWNRRTLQGKTSTTASGAQVSKEADNGQLPPHILAALTPFKLPGAML